MNNEAYRKRARNRLEIRSSTKDIAREAVENEFKKRARRGKHKNDGDSSDDDDPRSKKRWQQKHNNHVDFVKDRSVVESDHPNSSEKYRDRAKERQDDIPTDFNFDTTSNINRNTVSDVLFDNVVEALESGDLAKLKSFTTVNTNTTIVNTIPNTSKEALHWITNTQIVPRTTLGKNVLVYLQEKYTTEISKSIEVSPAGRNIQQSVLTFNKSINADPRDLLHSWECPSEQTFASSVTEHDDVERNNNIIPKASLCGPELLQKIQKCFNKRDHQKINMSKSTINSTTNVIAIAKSEQRTNINIEPENKEEDDDDDIFESVGEYNADIADQDLNSQAKGHSGSISATTKQYFPSDNGALPTETNNVNHSSEQSLDSNIVKATSQSLKGLQALDPEVYCDDGDDGFENDDDDDDNAKTKKHTKSKK